MHHTTRLHQDRGLLGSACSRENQQDALIDVTPSMAGTCRSKDGFQFTSKITTRFAAVRFSPARLKEILLSAF